MKKRIFILILAAMLLLSAVSFAQGVSIFDHAKTLSSDEVETFAQEETPDTRVFDYAELFTADEAETLRAGIIDFQENTGYDFAILTTNENLGTTDYQQLADDFYVDKSLGLGMNSTAILCYLDLYGDGYFYISVFGDLKNLMVAEDIQYLIDNTIEYFYDGTFTEGFLWTMHMMTEALTNIGSVNQTTRVLDYAELLTDEEIAALETAIADFRALTDRDFLFLSTYEDMAGNEDGDYMQEFYANHGFGTGDTRNGVMMYLDLFNSSYYVQNFGDLDTYVSQEDLNGIMEQSKPLMGEGRILDAALLVIDAYASRFR